MIYGRGAKVWHIYDERVMYVKEDMGEGVIRVSNFRTLILPYSVRWDEIRIYTPLEELL